MYLNYMIERASEYQPMPTQRFYTADELAGARYVVSSNDGDSSLCANMDEVMEWIEHNSWSRGFGNEA